MTKRLFFSIRFKFTLSQRNTSCFPQNKLILCIDRISNGPYYKLQERMFKNSIGKPISREGLYAFKLWGSLIAEFMKNY